LVRGSWTLRFEDDALEADYNADNSGKMVRQYRIVWPVVAILWGALALIDPMIGGSAANGAAITRIRLGVGTPLLAAVAAFGFAPRAWFHRGWQAASCVGGATILGCLALTGALLPEPARFDPHWGTMGIMLTIAGYSIIGVRLLYATTIVVLGNAANLTLLWILWREGEPFAASLIWILATQVVGFLSGYYIERARRDAFVSARLLARERERSERLLRNVLPEPIAERLKDSEERIAEHFDEATVLFGDIVGFTQLSETLPPDRLVGLLDDLFRQFDVMAERHGLEKIKTIGDAYMVVAGVPSRRPDHAQAIAAMALEMRDSLRVPELPGGQQLAMRIGIHSGPVVAGVIGKRKLLYDLWGDTVNTASRMESHGVAGHIQVSAATRGLLGSEFELTARGEIEIKGKGKMSTFFLERRAG
jgi:class 3 adenylate cyclase